MKRQPFGRNQQLCTKEQTDRYTQKDSATIRMNWPRADSVKILDYPRFLKMYLQHFNSFRDK